MAGLLPENTTRLQATAFVSGAELENVGRAGVIRAAAERLAEQALRKLLQDCIKTDSYRGYAGQTLRLDVFVLSPDELIQMLASARAEGERDALRWTPNVGIEPPYSVGSNDGLGPL